MSEANLWDVVLSAIEKRVNHESFTTWFKPIKFSSSENNKMRISVPDGVFEDWITNNYKEILDESLEEAGLAGYEVEFEIISNSESQDTSSVHNPDLSVLINPHKVSAANASISPSSSSSVSSNSRSTSVSSNSRSTGRSSGSPMIYSEDFVPKSQFGNLESAELPINSKYTFETFVVGSCNEFAHAAAQAVAEMTSRTYNPLYIYGGVGLGKTHLMCAIGHRVKMQNRHLRLCYISSEKFMNEMISAINHHQTTTFREKYRSIDVLLIDDIQFIGGKERTQEEFFHTFNALYEAQKQIVISSDCAPREIPNLEERLHSRFEWGLSADIQPPDLETKVAILRKKAESDKLSLPDDVAFLIAKKIRSNIRELEGSLARLTALSSLRGQPISLALAQEAFKNIVDEPRNVAVTIAKIQKIVAEHYDLKVKDLRSDSRLKPIPDARHIAMYLCKELTDASYPEIGREFGGKNHSSVIYGFDKISEKYVNDDEFHREIDNLKDRCR